MGGEWPEISLADVAVIGSGKRPPRVAKEATADCRIPVIGGGGPSGYTDSALFDGEVLVTGRVGTLGKLFAPSGPCWPSDNALVVRPSSVATDSRFLRYALQEVIAEAAEMNRGAANPLITQGDLGRLRIGYPPLPEQRAIAHILGTLEDKIELNRRMNETLEAMARALFKSWFVDFDPVRAKAEGRARQDGARSWQRGKPLNVASDLPWPGAEAGAGAQGDPGLPKPLADLFPHFFEDSELGEIPKTWEIRPFGDLLTDSIGGDWGKEAPDKDYAHPIAIIRGTDIPDVDSGGIGKVPIRYTTRSKLERRRLRDCDIVIEVSGGSPTQPTGRALLVSQTILDRFPTAVVCASFCRRFRPVSRAAGLLASQHLAWLYRKGGTWEYQNQSTGIANFQTTRFLESELLVWPNEALLSAYVELVDPITRRRALNESLTLTTLRDTLLPKLISGELRIKDAERFLEQAT